MEKKMLSGSESSNIERRYGWGRFRPSCLQWMNRPAWFLFCLTLFSFFQGLSVNGMTGLTIPSLEKRFQFSSKQTGLIASSNDISALILVSFASFCGGYGNKIKWLGYGSLVTGFGSLIYVLPHLLVGPYNPPSRVNLQTSTETCLANKTLIALSENSCIQGNSYNSLYLIIFIIAQLIMGAGTAPLFTLGPAYLDENVHPKTMPIYLAVWYVTTVMGPAFGFIAGGFILNLYVDIQVPVSLNLTPNDPRWIGAWWLGFFISGCTLMTSSIFILGFPREMPGSSEMRALAVKEGIVPPKDEEIKPSLKELPRATKILLVNKTFVCTSLGLTIGALFGLGIGPFFVKILLIKFGITMSEAGIGIGMSVFPGMAVGILLGGFIVRRLKLKDSTKRAAFVCAILQLLGVTGGLGFLIPGCNEIELAGVSLPYRNSNVTVLPFPGSEDQLDFLWSKCNDGCGCSTAEFSPVCGSDKITYFGACFAGCQRKTSKNSYANCTCIHEPKKKTIKSSLSQPPKLGTATQGYCNRNCKNFKIFLCAIFFQITLIFITAIPQKIVTLRSVPDNLRAYGLGLQFVFMRTLGSLPGPILFGSVIDSFCVLWKRDCDAKGNCLDYNINTLSHMLVTIGCSVQIVSCVFFFLAWYFFKQPGNTRRCEYNISNEGFFIISRETSV